MSAATDVYKDQVYCLWHARRLAEDFGPEGRKLSQDEEAVRAECLSLLREQMTPAERTEMEAWLIAHRPENEALDSDGWPCAPDPPKELTVVPVFMRNGEWAWFQGAPDGFRYILAVEPPSGVSTDADADADADRRPPVIVKTPGVADGRARVGGTRVPVWRLARCWYKGQQDVEILRFYPHLSLLDLEAARQYVSANITEIDQDIRENDSGP